MDQRTCNATGCEQPPRASAEYNPTIFCAAHKGWGRKQRSNNRGKSERSKARRRARKKAKSDIRRASRVCKFAGCDRTPTRPRAQWCDPHDPWILAKRQRDERRSARGTAAVEKKQRQEQGRIERECAAVERVQERVQRRVAWEQEQERRTCAVKGCDQLPRPRSGSGT